MCLSGCSTTAAATTGPARQPRPTSSTPATCTNPTRRSAFSSVRMAGTRVIGQDAQERQDGARPALFRRAFFHARGLALEIAQVVKLRAADFRRSRDLDLLNRRRMQREDAFDTLAERHLAHRERRASAAAVQADDDALEDLDALLVALAHLHVHFHGVARLYRRPFHQL